jgi:hypothetical protein
MQCKQSIIHASRGGEGRPPVRLPRPPRWLGDGIRQRPPSTGTSAKDRQSIWRAFLDNCGHSAGGSACAGRCPSLQPRAAKRRAMHGTLARERQCAWLASSGQLQPRPSRPPRWLGGRPWTTAAILGRPAQRSPEIASAFGGQSRTTAANLAAEGQLNWPGPLGRETAKDRQSIWRAFYDNCGHFSDSSRRFRAPACQRGSSPAIRS